MSQTPALDPSDLPPRGDQVSTDVAQQLRILTPGLSEDEIAAVIAVVSAAIARSASAARAPDTDNAWGRSLGPWRHDPTPGAGQWQAFRP